ncbi:class I SAM-dependent methyltransferase [Phenylobacterium montanum]|uniref:Class I SAM-dependent methyltransferase n=1 Tax=Phenylobacterium montanum TaxID=2823693 RepID=A0A975IWW9_9CAUL|nr:class I SAM-dependent methyltransferase [Caulobacter sp. S6]QUD88801.1 class I SAM-dependent methyltransferase [Caulobacter sp. S6]
MTLDRRGILLAGAALAVTPGLALATPADPILHKVIETGPRTDKEKARDKYRHPEESLNFWGLRPGQTVIDVNPGGGWWTDIIAPFLAQTGGHYIAATADLNDPKVSEEDKRERRSIEAKYVANHATFGDVAVAGFGPHSGALAPAGSVDLVLVSRETHNWVGPFIQKAFKDFHAALKPGGVLAIEDHRAPEGSDPAKGNGYIPESYVIDEAKKAGFKLVARSEINANPKDTKDYPFGVWTLPPTRQSAPDGKPPNPNFDHSKYDAIGESDRMTLKFEKVG